MENESPINPCILTDHIYFKEFCKPLSQEHSCKQEGQDGPGSLT